MRKKKKKLSFRKKKKERNPYLEKKKKKPSSGQTGKAKATTMGTLPRPCLPKACHGKMTQPNSRQHRWARPPWQWHVAKAKAFPIAKLQRPRSRLQPEARQPWLRHAVKAKESPIGKHKGNPMGTLPRPTLAYPLITKPPFRKNL